jgi:hypothetical protein
MGRHAVVLQRPLHGPVGRVDHPPGVTASVSLTSPATSLTSHSPIGSSFGSESPGSGRAKGYPASAPVVWLDGLQPDEPSRLRRFTPLGNVR